MNDFLLYSVLDPACFVLLFTWGFGELL